MLSNTSRPSQMTPISCRVAHSATAPALGRHRAGDAEAVELDDEAERLGGDDASPPGRPTLMPSRPGFRQDSGARIQVPGTQPGRAGTKQGSCHRHPGLKPRARMFRPSVARTGREAPLRPGGTAHSSPGFQPGVDVHPGLKPRVSTRGIGLPHLLLPFLNF